MENETGEGDTQREKNTGDQKALLMAGANSN